MTEEKIKQKFKETYPDFMYGDTPLSPYFDIWCYGIEIMEKQLEQANGLLRTFITSYFNLFEHDNRARGHKEINDVIEQAEQFLKEIEK